MKKIMSKFVVVGLSRLANLCLIINVIFVFTLANGAPLPCNSTISSVTVYNDRAFITRTSQFVLENLGRLYEILFTNLTSTLEDSSIQVNGICSSLEDTGMVM